MFSSLNILGIFPNCKVFPTKTLVLFEFVFWETVLLGSSGYPGIHYVDRLPLLPNQWIEKVLSMILGTFKRNYIEQVFFTRQCCCRS